MTNYMIDIKLFLKDGRMVILSVPDDLDWKAEKEAMIDELVRITQ